MIYQTWSMIGGLDIVSTTIATDGAGTVETETKATIAEALAAIERAGFQPAHVVRSRLYAVDSAARRKASDIRRVSLDGALRSASSSFVDPARIPARSRMMMDVIAVRPSAGAIKSLREYVPPLAPPMFVEIGGVVFLSGNTDVASDFADQVANIRAKIDAALAIAGSAPDRAVSLSAFVARSSGLDLARRAIAAQFPTLSCPMNLTLVDGFSAAEKRVEIEVTAKTG